LLALLLAPSIALADGPPPDNEHAWRPAAYSGWEYDYDDKPLAAHGRVESRRHEMLIKIGAATFLGAFGTSLIAAGIAHIYCNGKCEDNAWALLYLPFAGPAIAAGLPGVLKQRDAPFLATVLILDSTLQVGAGVLALVGFLWHSDVIVVGSTKPSWTILPVAAGAPTGLTFSLSAF
jgi:hypothetical protein